MWDAFMTVIESTRNGKVKAWRELHRRKGRAAAGLFLAEGPHLVEEAIRSGLRIEEIVLQRGVDTPVNAGVCKVTAVTEHVMRAVCESETPQGVVAVCRLPAKEELPAARGSWLLLDGMQDPGNVGALIRTADAAGCTCVVCGTGSADPFGGKALRASQGSVFHVPVIRNGLQQTIAALKKSGMTVMATSMAGESYKGLGPQSDFALVMGSEGGGVSREVEALCDRCVTIPMRGRAESLNVAVAAGVLLFSLGKDR